MHLDRKPGHAENGLSVAREGRIEERLERDPLRTMDVQQWLTAGKEADLVGCVVAGGSARPGPTWPSPIYLCPARRARPGPTRLRADVNRADKGGDTLLKMARNGRHSAAGAR